MALLFLDSFDHYSLSQIGRKWTTTTGSSSIEPGRTGNGLVINFPGTTKTLTADYATLAMGMAYKTGSLTGTIYAFNNVVDGSQFEIRVLDDGRLRIHVNIRGTTGDSAPSSFVLATGSWYYVEGKASIDGASPPTMTTSVRINGVEVLTFNQTASSGAAGAAFRAIHLGSNNTIFICDDLYVTDGEFLGDIRIGVLYPNAAGDSAAWTPSPAGANWDRVEEHPADDDTTYVTAATVGLKDLYNLDDLGAAFVGTIKGVQALWLVKKSDEGEGAVKGLWKSGATEITQADGFNYLAPNGFYPSATSWLYNIQPKRVSLFTAADWTQSEIDGLQLGITRTL